VPILGVVENMAWFTPEDMQDRKYFLFGQGGGKRLAVMAESVLLGQVPIVQGIREGGDSGKPVVVNPQSMVGEAFIKIAENTVRQVEIRNERLEPTKIVNVTS
jgi:ATP-binding protein involved in chromosome partitioning